MYVYVIGEKGWDAGPVKIGKANDPKHRLRTLQSGNHKPLELKHIFSTGQHSHPVEATVHRQFAKHRMDGGTEFFSISVDEAVEALRAAVEKMCPPEYRAESMGSTAPMSFGQWLRTQRGRPQQNRFIADIAKDADDDQCFPTLTNDLRNVWDYLDEKYPLACTEALLGLGMAWEQWSGHNVPDWFLWEMGKLRKPPAVLDTNAPGSVSIFVAKDVSHYDGDDDDEDATDDPTVVVAPGMGGR